MKTIYKDFGCSASIKDNKDGTARLIIRTVQGKKVHDKIHKNHRAAETAWYRYYS